MRVKRNTPSAALALPEGTCDERLTGCEALSLDVCSHQRSGDIGTKAARIGRIYAVDFMVKVLQRWFQSSAL